MPLAIWSVYRFLSPHNTILWSTINYGYIVHFFFGSGIQGHIFFLILCKGNTWVINILINIISVKNIHKLFLCLLLIRKIWKKKTLKRNDSHKQLNRVKIICYNWTQSATFMNHLSPNPEDVRAHFVTSAFSPTTSLVFVVRKLPWQRNCKIFFKIPKRFYEFGERTVD